MSEEKKLLKIQYGDVFIQIPVDDKKASEFVIKFLLYFIEELERKDAQPKTEYQKDYQSHNMG